MNFNLQKCSPCYTRKNEANVFSEVGCRLLLFDKIKKSSDKPFWNFLNIYEQIWNFQHSFFVWVHNSKLVLIRDARIEMLESNFSFLKVLL